MALPKIEAVVTADTSQAERGLRRVGDAADTMGGRVEKAGTRAGRLDTQMRRVGRSSGAMRASIQNASFQLSDMAVMMEMGVSTSRVMAQQLPQLLAGFGALGAVLGTVVAIGIPMATMFESNAEATEKWRRALGVVYPMIESIGAAMETVKEIGIGFAEAIINNLDRIIITAGVAASFFAGKWVAGFIAARVATFSLSGALIALRGALIRTGFGALIVGAGELVYQFTRLVTAAGSFGEAMGLLKDVAVEVWDRIKIVGKAGIDYLIGQFARMRAGFVNALAQMAGAASDFFLSMSDGLRGSGIPMLEDMASGLGSIAQKIGQAGGSLSRTAMGLDQSARDSLASAGAGFDAAGAPLESVQKIKDVLASIKDERLTLPDLLGVGEEGEDGEGGKGGKSAKEKLNEELNDQEKRIKEHFDRIKALTTGGLSDKLGAWGDYFSGLIALTGSSNDKLFAIAKAAKAGQALMDAWSAYNQVLADPSFVGRPWARAAAAANVLAAGIGAWNAIKSVSSSGSGATSASGGGGGGGAAAAAATQETRTVSEIRFMGSLGADGQTIVDIINDEYDRGNYVRAVVG